MARIFYKEIERVFEFHLHEETRTIWIDDHEEGEINNVISLNAIKSLHLLSNSPPYHPINVMLNTVGGCCHAGMAIYDAIKHCDCEVNITVSGCAMSMGSIILQAGTWRGIYPNGVIMVHDPNLSFEASSRTCENWSAWSKDFRNNMYRLFAERSGKTVDFWRRKCASDYILSAHEAKELGLVDAIIGEDEV